MLAHLLDAMIHTRLPDTVAQEVAPQLVEDVLGPQWLKQLLLGHTEQGVAEQRLEQHARVEQSAKHQ
jgi:hypothetical protein